MIVDQWFWYDIFAGVWWFYITYLVWALWRDCIQVSVGMVLGLIDQVWGMLWFVYWYLVWFGVGLGLFGMFWYGMHIMGASVVGIWYGFGSN